MVVMCNASLVAGTWWTVVDGWTRLLQLKIFLIKKKMKIVLLNENVMSEGTSYFVLYYSRRKVIST